MDDGGHATLVLFARSVHVEVTQADHGRVDGGRKAANVVVEDELGEAVDVERTLVFRIYGEAGGGAVGGGGRGVDEGDLALGREVQEHLRVVEVVPHHVLAVVFEGVRAGALMKDGFDRLVIEVACDEAFEEVELIHVVGVDGALQVEELGTGEIGSRGQVVDHKDVGVACAVKLVDEVRADEAGAAGNDDHVSGFSLSPSLDGGRGGSLHDEPRPKPSPGMARRSLIMRESDLSRVGDDGLMSETTSDSPGQGVAPLRLQPAVRQWESNGSWPKS